MAYRTILVETGADGVATITINRPEAMNSFTREMCQEFRAAWEAMRVDASVRAIVLRAAPGRAFSTGVDVKSGGPSVTMYEDLWTQVDPGEYLGPKQNKLWKPVIAAVHGIACGGAFYWLSEADIVICSEDAQFFDPHVTYGMVAALEPIGMRYRAPFSEVLRMTLMGNDERISAATALRISLVTEVVAKGHLFDRAHQIAARIAAKPPEAVQGSVRALWESLEVGRTAALQTALKYCQLGNPLATKQVDRAALMAQGKDYAIR